MSHDEAMLKLLAIEPANAHQLVRETGWGPDETKAVIERLVETGQVTFWNGDGFRWYGVAGYAWPVNRHHIPQGAFR